MKDKSDSFKFQLKNSDKTSPRMTFIRRKL